MFENTIALEGLYALALLAAILSSLAFLPYIRDTLAGRTAPQRSSWLVWSTLSTIAFASQVAEGATASLLFAGVQSAGTVVIFLLAIRSGRGHFLMGADPVVLAWAAGGLMLWYITDAAVWALAITCSISLAAGSVTILKAYRDPGSETLSCWTLSLFASACALASIGRPDAVLMMYPAYLLVLNAAIVGAVLLGRRSIAGSQADALDVSVTASGYTPSTASVFETLALPEALIISDFQPDEDVLVFDAKGVALGLSEGLLSDKPVCETEVATAQFRKFASGADTVITIDLPSIRARKKLAKLQNVQSGSINSDMIVLKTADGYRAVAIASDDVLGRVASNPTSPFVNHLFSTEPRALGKAWTEESGVAPKDAGNKARALAS